MIASLASAAQVPSARTLRSDRDVARRVRRLKWICALVICVATWYSVPYSFPLQLDTDPLLAAAQAAQTEQGSLSRQIAVPVLFLVAAYGLLRLPSRGVLAGKRLLQAALGYVGWVVLSAVWSTNPAVSWKRAVVFLMDVTFLYALARLATVLEMALLGFFCTGVVALLAAYADIVLLHSFAPLDPEYRFMGVMTANYQAMNLFVGLVCGLTLLQWRPRWTRWLASVLALETGLLFLTRARIGTFLLLIVLLFVVVRMAQRTLPPTSRALLIAGVLALLMPVLLFALGRFGGDALTSAFMMGRSDTENTASLSNRAPLWAELWDSVEARPLLGYGFDAFWTPAEVSRISLDQGWVVPHAHNTYLDQQLSLGIVGALLYAGTLLSACIVAWKRYVAAPTPSHFLPAVLLSWVALLSVTESLPIAPHLPTLLAYACVIKMCLEEKSEDPRSVDGGQVHFGTRGVGPGRGAFSGEVSRA